MFLIIVIRVAVWVPVFMTVLRAERVEGVCEAVEDTSGGFFGAGARDGEDGDVSFVFELAVELGPFVVFGY